MEEKVDKESAGEKEDKNEDKEQQEQCKSGQIKGERRGARQKIHLARNKHFLSVRGKWYLCKIQFQMSAEK